MDEYLGNYNGKYKIQTTRLKRIVDWKLGGEFGDEMTWHQAFRKNLLRPNDYGALGNFYLCYIS